MKLIDGDKLEKHLDYLIQKDEQFAKECSQSPNNEFERQRRYCFEANALAYGLCKNVMNYYLVADVQPIVYAHKTINVGRRSYCSNCGKLAIMEEFCSKCGAKVKDGDAE